MKTYRVYVVIEEYDADLDQYETLGEEPVTDELTSEDEAFEIRDQVVDTYHKWR